MFRVLIVDDEQPSAELIRLMLHRHFPLLSVIGIASDISTALAHLQTQDIDLVLLDIELKGQSAFDLLDKTLHRSWQFITLAASKEYAYKTFEYGGSGYLLKPVNVAELTQCLLNVLGKDFSGLLEAPVKC